MRSWVLAGLLLIAGGAFAVPVPFGETQPNLEKLRELRARRYAIAHPESEVGGLSRQALDLDAGEEGRVLVLLVEFGGTNTFTWTPGESFWDPFGYGDINEWNGTNYGDAVASQYFADYYGITGPTNVTYSGPLHNEIPRPPSGDQLDHRWNMVWKPDFSVDYYEGITFGNGTVFDFDRDDGSRYYADYTGISVSNYYAEMSGGEYALDGDVYGWITLTNSLMYYAADTLPGLLSVGSDSRKLLSFGGSIPERGDYETLVVDACRAAAEKYPEINWPSYDQDGDGVVDSLWIIYAGFGEELGIYYDNAYRPENRMWSHSFRVYPPEEIADGISVGRYTQCPEDAGLEVLAHEYGHNLGAIDLYPYKAGVASTANWSIMHSSRVGFPYAMSPTPFDPYHLDGWGWLNPLSITNPAVVTEVELYQAGTGLGVPAGMYRSARIQLEDQRVDLPVDPPKGASACWWGKDENYTRRVLGPGEAVLIDGEDATLQVQLAYSLEDHYDYLVLMVSSSVDRVTWSDPQFLSNQATEGDCLGAYDFEDDVVGFTGLSENYPDFQTETFDLSAFAGHYLSFSLVCLTDANTHEGGPYVGTISLSPGNNAAVRTWSADAPDAIYSEWEVTDGWYSKNPHYYYLEWRNTSESGGYDRSLGHISNNWGRATSGLLTWYINEKYSNNTVSDHLTDFPSYGAKGVALVIDAHPSAFYETNSIWERPCINPLTVYDNRRLNMDAAFGARETFLLPNGKDGALPGRPFFTDSRNYCAGAEYTYLSPTNVPAEFAWLARKFDGSVVTPSKKEYPLRAPGMPDSTEIYRVWYEKEIEKAYQAKERFDGGGSTGNPLDVGGEYGWNVEVVEDHGTSAVVRIWNSHVCGPYPVLVDCFGEGSTFPEDDFLAEPGTNVNVQVEAAPYHHITRLLYNGAEVADAVGLQSYSLDLGEVSSNSAVYAFFSADRVPGSTIPQKWFADQGIPLTEDVLTADYDGDGLNNAAEYAAGTRANDATSGLALSVVPNASGTRLRWVSEWNHWYEVEVSTNLLADPFRKIDGPLPGEYDLMEYSLPDYSDESGFYRLRVVPAPEE